MYSLSKVSCMGRVFLVTHRKKEDLAFLCVALTSDLDGPVVETSQDIDT